MINEYLNIFKLEEYEIVISQLYVQLRIEKDKLEKKETKPELELQRRALKELQEVIESTDLCMATSGNYLQYYFVEGQRRSHTIDPRTGYPVHHSLLSATVKAGSCMRADALATACMVLGDTEALEMIERSEDAACYLIVAQGDSLQIITSSRW